MKLRGVLDSSLSNFICIRGYKQMRDLYKISKAKDYQRGLGRMTIGTIRRRGIFNVSV